MCNLLWGRWYGWNLDNGFDTSLAEGVYLLTPFAADATDDATVHFVTEYQKLMEKFLTSLRLMLMMLFMLCTRTLVAGGVTYDMTAQEIADILIEQFTTMTFDGVTGTSVTWAANGEVSKTKAVIIRKWCLR